MQAICPRCGNRLAPGRRPGLCAECLGQAPGNPANAGGRRHDVNVQLQCRCGCQFFVARSSGTFAECPRCRAAVPTTGASNSRPVEPHAAEAPAPEPARTSKVPLLVIAGAGTIVLAASILSLVLLLRRSPPPEPRPLAAPAPAPIPISAAPGRPMSPAAPKTPSADYVDYTTRIERLAAQCNMAGIAAAVLLDSGRSQEVAELEDRMRVFDREIRDFDRLRAERGERIALPQYFLAGDRLAALSNRVRDPGRPVPFAEELKEWLRSFRAGARETATVLRGVQRISFEAAFPERTKELNLVSQRTGIMLGEGSPIAETPATPTPATPPAPAGSPFAALLADARARLVKLHPWYRARAETEELDRLRQATGDPGDPDGLRYRVLSECLDRYASEQASFARRSAELEATLAALPGPTDVVHFKDGRKIEGAVEEQTEEKIRVRSRLGAATFPADQVLRIEKGKGTALAFPAKMQSARGKAPDLEALLGWCRENNLPVHRESVANALLHLEPGHDAARADAGFSRLPSGEWARGDDARLREGKIEWQGRHYAPDQLRQHLRSLGYVQVGTIWYEKVAGSFKIDNFYRDENLLSRHLRDGVVQNQLQTDRDTVYDVRLKAWVPRTRQVAVARYLASGFVDLEIPGPILECRVKARGQTPRVGDSVTVIVLAHEQDAWPKVLYNLNAPGENTQSYDVTDKLLGQTRVIVRGRTGGGGMFLPGDNNDIAILEVKYSYGKPLAKLNELLAARGEAGAAPPAPETVAASAFAEARSRTAGASASNRANYREALDEVRRAMEFQTYHRELPVPVRYAEAASVIQDPLYPRLDAASPERLFAMSRWWTSMPQLERVEFAAFYGLWCARVRAGGR